MRKVFFTMLIGIIAMSFTSIVQAASLNQIQNKIYTDDIHLNEPDEGDNILDLVLRSVQQVKENALPAKEVKSKKSIKQAITSWYGKRFHGRLTASGTKFNMNELTAAHKTLPFGTKVKLTNKNNGKSVVVTITDRGPFVKSRAFDLSKAAFSKISDIDDGTAKVQYEIL